MAVVDYRWFIQVAVVLASLASVSSEHLTRLQMEEGDLIACRLNYLIGYFNAYHWMLATGGDTLIHAIPKTTVSTKSRVLEQTKSEAINLKMFDATGCYNLGRNYHKDPLQAVKDARSYKDSSHWYNMFLCNCEHWVNKWIRDRGGFSSSAWCWSMPQYCDAY